MTRPERPRADLLAEAAERLAPSLDLARSPDQHIYAALDEAGIKELGERKRLIPAIKKALRRRTSVPLSERQDLIEDARLQELRHPKDDEDEG